MDLLAMPKKEGALTANRVTQVEAGKGQAN
jgi:hypothetical protein